MKLATICDGSHVISYTRPSSPLFFSGGIERKAWERGYLPTSFHPLHPLSQLALHSNLQHLPRPAPRPSPYPTWPPRTQPHHPPSYHHHPNSLSLPRGTDWTPLPPLPAPPFLLLLHLHLSDDRHGSGNNQTGSFRTLLSEKPLQVFNLGEVENIAMHAPPDPI